MLLWYWYEQLENVVETPIYVNNQNTEHGYPPPRYAAMKVGKGYIWNWRGPKPDEATDYFNFTVLH